MIIGGIAVDDCALLGLEALIFLVDCFIGFKLRQSLFYDPRGLDLDPSR